VRSANGVIEYGKRKFKKEVLLITVVENFYNFSDFGFFVALDEIFD
jgi:hypothetical protein